MTTYLVIITTLTFVVTAIHSAVAIWQRHEANKLNKKSIEYAKKGIK